MRAMPSPQESTMPVSRTSSCFSYSLICSRMMSLISAARICIAVPPGRRLAAALGHLLRQAGELGPQAPVVDRPAGVEHDPRDQLGVELGGGDHPPAAREAPRPLDELVPLGRAPPRRLEGPVLAGQREHGARIALAEAAAHAGAPAPATNSRTNRS